MPTNPPNSRAENASASPVVRVEIELGFDGKALHPIRLPTGQHYQIIHKSPVLSLENLYHDNAPVANAPFKVELTNGQVIQGILDELGQAQVRSMGARPVKVGFGADPRPYRLIGDVANPAYLPTPQDSDALAVDSNYKGANTKLTQADEMALSVLTWVWGTVQGNFNQKQSISQIMVDAVIGMIPLVGEVTAARDIIAVIFGMIDDEEKRKSKLEWLSLTVLVFALIPVIGGAIKGVGKLLLRVGEEAGANIEHLRDIIAVLNRLGMGDAQKWLKSLHFESYSQDLVKHYNDLNKAMDGAISKVQGGMGKAFPAAMQKRLVSIRKGLHEINQQVGQRIPEGLKELSERLKVAQRQIYQGDWHEVPKSLTVKARVVEAKIIDVPGGKKWIVEEMKYPQNGKSAFTKKEGFPNLADEKNPYYTEVFDDKSVRHKIISCFSGSIEPIFIPEGEMLYRVVESVDQRIGSWWILGIPPDPKEWREGSAVLESWNKNGYYVEMKVPKGGIYTWQGKASGQVENDIEKAENSLGQYLEGGGWQIFVDIKFHGKQALEKHVSDLMPTDWDPIEHMGINVASKKTGTYYLDVNEIETKSRSIGQLSDKAIRNQRQKENDRQ
jgi:hypothetical protein